MELSGREFGNGKQSKPMCAARRRAQNVGARRAALSRAVEALENRTLLSGVGLVAGLAGAVLVARLLSSMLYGVGAGGLAVFAAAAAAMAGIAFAATIVPARRAMRVDPTVALRVD